MSANYNIAFGGAANQAQSNFTEQMALNQLDYEKEVRTAFVARSEFAQRSTQLPIEGYGTRIPAYGIMSAAYHTPGTVLTGQADVGNANQRFGYLDDRLVAHIAVDEYDGNQRSTLQLMPARLRALGTAIALVDEKQAAITTILAARASATVTGGPVGGALIGSGAGNSATAMLSLIWAAKTQMDNNFVDEMGRMLALTPARYNLLVSQVLPLSDRNLGMNGSLNTGSLPQVAGFELFKSSNMPSTNISAPTTGQRNSYTGDFRQTIGVAFQQEATGTLVPQADLPMGGKGNEGITSNRQPGSPIKVKSIDDDRSYSTLYLASLISGHCVIRPECAVELKDDTL